ncbi:MAG: prepilin peptidase [Atopobiaceae bacterium]|nr:prepilin peptidase [Atopobiaceae bacterium]
MKELLVLVVFACASILDIRSRTIPNLFPLILFAMWCSGLIASENREAVLLQSLISEAFFLSVLFLTQLFMKVFSRKGFLGGGDIKLIFSGCLFLDIKETFVFLIFSNFLGVLCALILLLWKNRYKDSRQQKFKNSSLNPIFQFTFPFAPFLSFGMALALFLR